MQGFDPIVSGTSSSAAGGNSWSDTITSVVHTPGSSSRKALLAQLAALSKERAGAYDYLRALDHTLASVGSGLRDFLVPRDAPWETSAPRPLAEWEERQYIPWQDWGFEVPRNFEGVGTKSIIKDKRTGRKKTEVAEFFLERPMLVVSCDEGGCFWPNSWFLTGFAQMRGIWLRDPYHRSWNDWKLAVDHSGWKAVKLQGCLIMNLRHGPWLSASWFQQLVEGMEFELCGSGLHDGLFNALYSSIVADHGLDTDADVGSSEHIAMSRRRVAGSDIFRNKGEKVAMRSFYKWVTSMKTFLVHWHEMLLSLLVLGMSAGWFKSGPIPFLDNTALAAALVPDNISEQADQAPSAAGCNDDKTLAKLRAACKNGMHVAAVLLATDEVHFACKVIATMSEPLQIEHHTNVKRLKGADAMCDFYVDLAKGGYVSTMIDVWSVLQDTRKLSFMGLDMDADSFGVSVGARADIAHILDTKVQAETSMAKSIVTFAINLLRFRCSSLSLYNHSYPGLFALLCSKDPRTVDLGLRLAKEAWEALAWAEDCRHVSEPIRLLLEQIPMSRWVAIRETLIGLSQWQFQWVPPTIRDVWKTAYCSFGQTLVVEDAFNAVKDHQRDSKNLRMSRINRFFHPIAEKTISRRHGRTEVKPNAADRKGPSRINATAFESQSLPPTVEDKLLRQVMNDKPEWKSFTPLSSVSTIAAFQALLQCHRAKNPEMAGQIWRSKFVQEGTVLRHQREEMPWLALSVTAFGILCWPCEFVDSEAECTIIRPLLDQSQCVPEWRVILHFDDFIVYRFDQCTPFVLKHKHQCEASVDTLGIELTTDGAPIPMLHFAATEGFRGIPEPILDRLMRHLGLTLSRGSSTNRSVLAKVEALIRHIIPDIGDKDLETYMKRRCPDKQSNEVLLNNLLSNSKCTDELLESTDNKEARQLREETATKTTRSREISDYLAAKAKKEMTPRPAASGSGKGSGASSSAGPQGSKRPSEPRVIERHDWPAHVMQAKAMLPDISGCILQPYPLKNSFQVYYPNAAPPRSKCFSYSTQSASGLTEREAMVNAVRWAWAQHHREQGAECPFLFEGLAA